MANLTRRELAGLMLGSAFLAACGGSKSSLGGGSSSASTGGVGGGDVAALPPVTLHGTTVPAGEQITVADARRYVGIVSGTWRGGWHDSTGASGTTDVTAALNALRRTARITVAASGNLLTQPVRAETYAVDLAGFPRNASSWHVVSPQVGSIVAAAQSGTDFTGTVTNAVPPSIHTIDVQATRVGDRVDLTYQLNRVSGAPVHGTMAWAKGATRATPAALDAGSAATPANVQSGAYAAGLLTSVGVSKAVGKRFGAPQSNGGRLAYANGVNVSDGLVNSIDKGYVVQYSVYLCASAADANKFWKGESAQGLPSIHGPWRDAFFSNSTVYAFDGRNVTTVQVLALHGQQPADQFRGAALAITKDLLHNLR